MYVCPALASPASTKQPCAQQHQVESRKAHWVYPTPRQHNTLRGLAFSVSTRQSCAASRRRALSALSSCVVNSRDVRLRFSRGRKDLLSVAQVGKGCVGGGVVANSRDVSGCASLLLLAQVGKGTWEERWW